MESIWQKTVSMPEFPAIEGTCTTDVAIIGGGMTGILTAFFLRRNGVDCMVLEKERICSGTTAGTTAKLSVQHGLIYHELIKTKGAELAGAYLSANRRALGMWEKLTKEIDCDYQQTDSYIYSMERRRVLEEELEALRRIGGTAEFCENPGLPMKVAGAVKIPRQAQFHPLKWVAAIAGELPIYENTFVKEYREHSLLTEDGEIRAKQVVVATHFPMFSKHGGYFLKLYQDRSYVLALRQVPEIKGCFRDEKERGLSFRMFGDILLLGGGSHRTGKNGGNWEELRAFAKEYYPRAEEVCAWAAQDCISLDRRPYIGLYSKHTPELYVASGFHKWGMTGAMLAALVLTDRILGRRNEYEALFCPDRVMKKTKLLVNGMEATKNLLTISGKRCPHLGCALKWNRAEQSWDCPCHGSRFSETGKLLNNPANGDLRK